MWRNFFLVLVFFIVAQTASAQEISIIKPQESAEITWQLPQAERLIENNSTEISSSAMFFDEQPAETANLPRITFASPLIFADHRQRCDSISLYGTKYLPHLFLLLRSPK